MKKLGKPVSIIIALVILIFSVLSVFGYSYYTGDIKNTVFKGFGSLDWGIDASGGTKISVTPASADEAHAVADIIEERAASYGLTEYQLYVDSNTSDVVFVVPASVGSDYDADEVASYLTCTGNLTLRPGNSYTDMIVDSSGGASFITPSGDTANTVLLDSSTVKNATSFEYNDGSTSYYYVEVSFNDEGTELLTLFTNADTGAYYNQTISVWLDDTMLAYPTVSEELTTGSISFSGEHMTADKAKLVSAVIDSGVMPCELTISSFTQIEPTLGNHVTDLVLWLGVAALVIIAFVTIFKFKAGGIVTVLALIMQFSSLLAILTGFVGNGSTYMVTIPAAAAMALSVMITVLSCVLISNTIKAELNNGTVLISAISAAYKKNKNTILDINVILAIVSLMGMFVFGTSGVVLDLFGSSVAGGISSFCYVVFFGSLLNFVTGYILPQLMFRSLSGFKCLNKPSAFGGNK